MDARDDPDFQPFAASDGEGDPDTTGLDPWDYTLPRLIEAWDNRDKTARRIHPLTDVCLGYCRATGTTCSAAEPLVEF